MLQGCCYCYCKFIGIQKNTLYLPNFLTQKLLYIHFSIVPFITTLLATIQIQKDILETRKFEQWQCCLLCCLIFKFKCF